jgi:hypothetical protein
LKRLGPSQTDRFGPRPRGENAAICEGALAGFRNQGIGRKRGGRRPKRRFDVLPGLLALALLPQPASAATTPATEPPKLVATAPVRPPESTPLEVELQGLRLGLDELHQSMQKLEETPPWAERAHQQLLRRMERLQEMQERLAARVETPMPRLDEPIVLFTVGGATLLLGFFAGRTVQRRSSRRDRFRL